MDGDRPWWMATQMQIEPEDEVAQNPSALWSWVYVRQYRLSPNATQPLPATHQPTVVPGLHAQQSGGLLADLSVEP